MALAAFRRFLTDAASRLPGLMDAARALSAETAVREIVTSSVPIP